MEAILAFLLRCLMALQRLFKRGGPYYHSVLCGFVGSRAIMAGVRLGIFDALRSGPRSKEDLLTELKLNPDAARVFLDACILHNLLGREGDRYWLRKSFACWLQEPGHREDILQNALLFDDTTTFEHCMQGDWPQDSKVRSFWGHNYSDPASEQSRKYSDLMHATVATNAPKLARCFPFGSIGSLFDVGGGSAGLAIALAREHPSLKLGVLDLPGVEDRARERIAEAGLQERIDFIGGDFLNEPLPRGWPVMMLHRVLWDWDDERASVLLGRIHEALPAGGRLLITEGMWSGDPVVDLLLNPFHLYMQFGGFHLRSREQVAALVRAAGFASLEFRSVQPLLLPLVVAEKG